MRFSNAALEAVYRDVLSVFGKRLDLYESGNLDDNSDLLHGKSVKPTKEEKPAKKVEVHIQPGSLEKVYEQKVSFRQFLEMNFNSGFHKAERDGIPLILVEMNKDHRYEHHQFSSHHVPESKYWYSIKKNWKDSNTRRDSNNSHIKDHEVYLLQLQHDELPSACHIRNTLTDEEILGKNIITALTLFQEGIGGWMKGCEADGIWMAHMVNSYDKARISLRCYGASKIISIKINGTMRNGVLKYNKIKNPRHVGEWRAGQLLFRETTVFGRKDTAKNALEHYAALANMIGKPEWIPYVEAYLNQVASTLKQYGKHLVDADTWSKLETACPGFENNLNVAVNFVKQYKGRLANHKDPPAILPAVD